jgi:hypothetical protein
MLYIRLCRQALQYLPQPSKKNSGDGLFQHEFSDLHGISREAWQQINNFLFMKFKSLLNMQQAFIDK